MCFLKSVYPTIATKISNSEMHKDDRSGSGDRTVFPEERQGSGHEGAKKEILR